MPMLVLLRKRFLSQVFFAWHVNAVCPLSSCIALIRVRQLSEQMITRPSLASSP